MANEDQEEKLSIPFDVKGIEDLEAAGDNLEKLRDAMRGATEELKANSAALRTLKGDSDEVKAARAALKGAIQAEQDAISSANLKLIKQGTTFEQLAQAEKKATAETKRLADEQKKLADEQDKAKENGNKFGESMRAGALLAVGAVTALAAAVLAAGVSFVHGVEALARWTIETANAQRAMGLLREAVGGTVANGEALGTWVDQLARKLPLSTEKLNELATNITRTFNGTMVGGQGIVDTFQAVAGASAAMGDQAGAAIQSIIDRGKQFGRGGVGLFELQGTGLQFDKLAAKVAKSMNLTMAQARMALANGMVPIEKLAASLKDTVNEQFGGINAKKFLDLNSIAQRFQDRLAKLTKGFDMTPILEALEKLSSMFDTSTVTGDALRQMMTVFGRLLGSTFKEGTPVVQRLFETMIIWTQRAMIEGLKLAIAVKKMFAGPEGGNGLGAALMAIPEQLAAITNPLEIVSAMFADLTRGLDLGAKAVTLGESLITGFVQGVKNAWNGAVDTVSGFADGVKNTFKNALGIHSPSAVFAEYGQQTTAGFVQGVDGSAGDAAAATGRMAPSPGGAASSSGGRSLSVGSVTVIVQAAPGANGKELGEAAGESFKAKILAFLEELGAAEGVPMQAVEGS